MLESDDAVLLQRIAAGEREAFQAFYQRYGGRVLAYVRLLSRDREIAEDVVQEVFLTVWRKAASYRVERGDIPGWLYTVTRNKLVDLWRRRGRAVEDENFDLGTLLADEPGAEAHVVSLSVRKALTGLKREQREAVEMAYFGGLTYEETASRLKVPLGTLKSRIRAGLAAMRSSLLGTRGLES
jgi:RNA polymerase sigma-70 factor (ECF subfamily)